MGITTQESVSLNCGAPSATAFITLPFMTISSEQIKTRLVEVALLNVNHLNNINHHRHLHLVDSRRQVDISHKKAMQTQELNNLLGPEAHMPVPTKMIRLSSWVS